MSDTAFDINTVIRDAKQILTNPVAFYKAMPQEGGFVNPLIFLVVMAVISGIILGVFGLVGLSSMGGAGFAALSAIILFPIAATIASFIGAAIVFVIWKLMGSQKSYEVAYRCLAYTFAILPILSILDVIPYISSIVQPLWACFLLYIASLEVHQLKASVAKIVFGILAAIGVLFGVNAESKARKYEALAKQYAGQSAEAAKALENLQNMSSEEAGKEIGKFLKGLEQGMEKAEQQKTE